MACGKLFPSDKGLLQHVSKCVPIQSNKPLKQLLHICHDSLGSQEFSITHVVNGEGIGRGWGFEGEGGTHYPS